MEIERKWLLSQLPGDLEFFYHTDMVQGYICTDPTVRVRRDGGSYYLTVKGQGTIAREEYNLEIDSAGFERLLEKCEGILIEKTRYRIPITPEGRIIRPSTEPEHDAWPGHSTDQEQSIGQMESTEPDHGAVRQQVPCMDRDTDPVCHAVPQGKVYGLTAELDVFRGVYSGLKYVEVEFADLQQAEAFKAPVWFGREVTGLPGYSNGDLSRGICADESLLGKAYGAT